MYEGCLKAVYSLTEDNASTLNQSATKEMFGENALKSENAAANIPKGFADASKKILFQGNMPFLLTVRRGADLPFACPRFSGLRCFLAAH